jgi:N-acetylglucosaminyl-diphospho-decaprenol L-rhamnosyltransferase
VSLSIDVVIPTYNGWELTESCLRHLARQTLPHTVVVADNASTDGTPEQLRTAFPDAKLVEIGDNLGFAVATNRGAAAGSADVIVLLNNDVNARPDFLARLIEPLASDSSVGSVSALMTMPGDELIDSVGLAVDRTLAGFPRHHGRPVSEAANPRPVLVGPSGGAGAYQRTAWEQAGGLDEHVFAYLEDLDLALRLRTAGWQAAAAPAAIGTHQGSATIGKRSAWQRRQAAFSRAYFLRSYGVLAGRTAPRTLATEAAVVLGDLVLNRDLAALRGRIAGWNAARGHSRRFYPPPEAIDPSISLLRSLRLRAEDFKISHKRTRR